MVAAIVILRLRGSGPLVTRASKPFDMSKRFLVGNFLPAYSDSYRYRAGYGRKEQAHDPEWLAQSFTNRSRRAREQRQSYVLRMQMAMIAALMTVLGASAINIRGGSDLELAMVEQETVDIQEILQTVHEVLPPPPPKPAVPIAVPDDELLEDDELDLDVTLDIDAPLAIASPPPPPVEEVVEDEPEIFVVVEEQPEMIGGVAELSKAVKYPTIARQAGIEGMVVVKVVITQEGLPESPEILSSPSEVLNEAAIEAVMQQRFKPGRQRGRAVACFMAIPVRFRLTAGVG